jgi:hypothetical protein
MRWRPAMVTTFSQLQSQVMELAMIIEPYVGVGPIRLGMRRADVRAAMGTEARELMKYPSLAHPIDIFKQQRVHVYYRKGLICEAVELFGGVARPLFEGQDLLAIDFATLIREFRTKDEQLELDGSMFISRKYGVSAYGPALEDKAQAVMVFERGYYDKQYRSSEV